jgi:SpoVK/Ycf46/Vps4 family AAA+-type ATPase
MALVRIADATDVQEPVLSPEVRDRVDQFLAERASGARLLREGMQPPSTLLLIGAPGTGKTMLAGWIAKQLALPFVVQDLATSISSLLGKTGFNLRRTLDYARSQPCVLLLDEFDAIAKRRDDDTELGELKRIVNVLLKELEQWPVHSVLVAATNHPELLDPAINRRFQVVITIPSPGLDEGLQIIRRASGRFGEQASDEVTTACAQAMLGASGSDLERMVQAAVRRHLARSVPYEHALIGEAIAALETRQPRSGVGPLVRALRDANGEKITVREIAAIVGRTVSTVQHHLKQEPLDG